MGVKRSSSGVFVLLVLVVSLVVTSPVVKAQGGLLGPLLGNNGLVGGLAGNNGLVGGLLGNNGLIGGLLGNNGLLTQLLTILLGPITQITGNLFQITGTVLCAANATASAPPFSNATVLLVCNATIVANTTTNGNGVFSALLSLPNNINVQTISLICKIVITTPLSTCNPSLPSTGGLVAPLTSIGNTTIGGLFTLFNIVPLTFRYVSDILSVILGLI